MIALSVVVLVETIINPGIIIAIAEIIVVAVAEDFLVLFTVFAVIQGGSGGRMRV